MALVEGLGMDDLPHVPRLATGLAGGMGGTHQWTCGAINSAAVIAGILRGRDEVQPGEGHPVVYDMLTHLIRDAEAEFGTILCSELTGISPDRSREEWKQLFEEKDCKDGICNPFKAYVVRRVYRLLEEYPASDR